MRGAADGDHGRVRVGRVVKVNLQLPRKVLRRQHIRQRQELPQCTLPQLSGLSEQTVCTVLASAGACQRQVQDRLCPAASQAPAVSTRAPAEPGEKVFAYQQASKLYFQV